jgi:16S rRNA pseudouridine516 synthase
LARPLADDVVERMASGDLMLEADDRPCLPAELTVIDEHHAVLVLHEGRYHQVRRMFAALGNHVEGLKRTHIGRLALADTGLEASAWQDLTAEELWQRIL